MNLSDAFLSVPLLHTELFCMGFSFAAFFFFVLITRTTELDYDSEFFSFLSVYMIKAIVCRIRNFLTVVATQLLKIKMQIGSSTLLHFIRNENPRLFLSFSVSLQSVSLCRRWLVWWAGLFWWWAGGVLVQSWPVSSWSAWCLASSSPPPSSSLLSVGKNTWAPQGDTSQQLFFFLLSGS